MPSLRLCALLGPAVCGPLLQNLFVPKHRLLILNPSRRHLQLSKLVAAGPQKPVEIALLQTAQVNAGVHSLFRVGQVPL